MKPKFIIDDGFNAELVEGATFCTLFEIPLIKRPSSFIIPSRIIPFSQRHKSKDFSEFVAFYEHDVHFAEILSCAKKLLPEMKKFAGIISPDCSLYRDMPLAIQIINTYRNRQIGHYLQSQGCYVIPNIRWGDERSFSRLIPSEVPFAFAGVEKHGIVSIGTYGAIRGTENKFYFREGLRAMLCELEPEIVIVYGSMPENVFGQFQRQTRFVQIPDWTTLRHQKSGGNDGQRN